MESKGVILITDCHYHGKYNTGEVITKGLIAKYQILKLQLRGFKELNQNEPIDLLLQRCYPSETQ